MRFRYQQAFTVVEIIVVITILATLATTSVVAFGSWRREQAATLVKSDVQQAASGLSNYKNFKDSYPPNLAGTGFAASNSVALTLSTNAPSVGVYEGLQPDQNAQLFLNTCNANLFSTPNNTACGFEGNKTGAKIHAKGTNGSNAIWSDPINQTDLSITCGSDQAACNQAINDMITQFSAQGGTFPIEIPEKNVPLPEPTQVPNGPASRYCLEGRANDYPDIAYYILSETKAIVAGGCPNDPSLQYYQ